MYDRILLAVGGDDPSFEPARVAGRLAHLLGARLTITSVHRPTPQVLGEPYYTDSVHERLEETEAILAHARRVAEAEGARAEVERLEGPTIERIVDHAREGGYGLIVIGTRRLGRLQSALLGSVSAGVAAHSPIPVLVVPEPAANESAELIEPAVAGHARR